MVEDWVLTRAKRERTIRKARLPLWGELCAALEQAVRSFNRCYGCDGEVTYYKQYDDHVWVRSERNPQRAAHFVLTLEHSVEAEVTAAGKHTARFVFPIIGTDHGPMFSVGAGGKAMTCEDVSRSVLEPILFTEPAELFARFLEDKQVRSATELR